VKNAFQDWTEYGYNEVGNLISQTDANQHTTSYKYDGVGRRTAVILPMDQQSNMTYDAVGNLKTYTDFNRNTTIYSYDPLNWMTSKQFQDESKVMYTYTAVGLQDIITFVDANGQTTATYDYDYDERDRLVKRTDPDGRKIEYTYDAASNRTSVTIASGTVNYTFDVRNRLDQVIENGVITADYDYDAVSNLVRTTLVNGTQEIRSYDDLNRLKYLENHKGDTILSSYSYTLDKVGNRTKVVEQDGRTVDYIYDDLYRLTQEKITDAVNGNRIYDYTYDKVGNRKTKGETVNSARTVTDYAYDANDRLLNEKVNQQVVANYIYDNNGNTLTKTENSITTEYTWNYENRLIAAIVKDANGATQQSMQYRYNDSGIRVASTVNGVETRYLIDEMQPYAQVLEEYSPNGAVQVEYVYGNDLIAQEQGNSRTYYHVDGLGSTRVLTNATGSVVTIYDYEAFGELISSTGGIGNNYLFAGEQFDEALGDYYNRARYYDADTGRFIRKDDYEGNKKEPLTLHKYIYANDNPVQYIDPSGLASQDNGNDIAAYIELYFWAEDPLRRAAEHPITRIWGNLDINPSSIPFPIVPARARRAIPDMVDYRNKELYEIGTLKDFGEKRDKMDNLYLPAINNALTHLGRVADWRGGETFISPSPLTLPTGQLVIVMPPVEGVIAYQVLFDGYYVATLAASLYTASAIAEYLTAEIAVTASLTKGFI
jgi:RHS repeat-associated protein